MKKTKLVLVPLLLMLASCATTELQSYRTSRVVELPDPEVKMVITITNDNLEILGSIDLKKTVLLEDAEHWVQDDTDVELERIGVILSGSLSPLTRKGNFWDKTQEVEKDLLNSLVFDAIELYPEMDYILFPKIEIEKVTGLSITMRLSGKAAKINL